MVGDQVAEHLGVGFGLEGVVLADQEAFDRGVIFDDAVVHERELAIAAEMRVRVGVGHPAVGGPTRMADAGRAGKMVFRDLLGEIVHPADLFDDVEVAVLLDGESGRIVAAVFQALQSLEQDGSRLLFTHIADDAAHIFRIFSGEFREAVKL
jgi:hypothetical protein